MTISTRNTNRTEPSSPEEKEALAAAKKQQEESGSTAVDPETVAKIARQQGKKRKKRAHRGSRKKKKKQTTDDSEDESDEMEESPTPATTENPPPTSKPSASPDLQVISQSQESEATSMVEVDEKTGESTKDSNNDGDGQDEEMEDANNTQSQTESSPKEPSSSKDTLVDIKESTPEPLATPTSSSEATSMVEVDEKTGESTKDSNNDGDGQDEEMEDANNTQSQTESSPKEPSTSKDTSVDIKESTPEPLATPTSSPTRSKVGSPTSPSKRKVVLPFASKKTTSKQTKSSVTQTNDDDDDNDDKDEVDDDDSNGDASTEDENMSDDYNPTQDEEKEETAEGHVVVTRSTQDQSQENSKSKLTVDTSQTQEDTNNNAVAQREDSTPSPTSPHYIPLDTDGKEHPVIQRFVENIHGEKRQTQGTMPGNWFWSDIIDDPICHQYGSTPLTPIHGNYDKSFPAAVSEMDPIKPEDEAKYDEFFQSNQEEFDDSLVCTKVGTETLTVKDIKTLGPTTWLNDKIVNSYSKILVTEAHQYADKMASKSSNSRFKKTPLFDSSFFALIEESAGDNTYYNYNKVRGMTQKRLYNQSPRTYTHIIFLRNVTNIHWQSIVVYPGGKTIYVLDSMGPNPDMDGARTIFRWLYDEMNYNWQNQTRGLFDPSKVDFGWRFYADKTLNIQRDTYNCGVWMLGYIACILYHVKPQALTDQMVKDYRKRIFNRLIDVNKMRNSQPQPVVYGPPQWVEPTYPKLFPLPRYPPEWSDRYKRGLIKKKEVPFAQYDNVSVLVEYMKKQNKETRDARLAEQQRKRIADAAKRKEANKRLAKQKKDRAGWKAKLDKARAAADLEVDKLLKGNQGAILLKKRGNFEKKRRTLLKKIWSLSPDEADLHLKEQKDRKALDGAHDYNATYEDEISQLCFTEGWTKEDPPDEKTKQVSKHEKVGRQTVLQYKYNFFLGKSSDGKVFNYQISPDYCEFVFDLKFTQLVRRTPGNWLHVPLGNADTDHMIVDSSLLTSVMNRFRQKQKDFCLHYAIAGCLQYMGKHEPALEFARAARQVEGLPSRLQFRQMNDMMANLVPSTGIPKLFNRKSQKTKTLRHMSIEDIVTDRTPYLTVVQPIGNDNSSDHCVCVVDDLIFDARFDYALKLCKESFDMICGYCGAKELGCVFRFMSPYKIKAHKVKHREMKTNWDTLHNMHV